MKEANAIAKRTEQQRPGFPAPSPRSADAIDIGRAPRSRRAIAELFEMHAAATPDAVALLYDGRTFTYGDLNRRANRFARHLCAQGVGIETLVGVCLRRSPEMIVALLAILKAGGAYVPLDPDYPRDRLAFILADTAAPVIVADAGCAAALPAENARTVLLDADDGAIAAHDEGDLAAPVAPENLAYVMYTSGSTGAPKGVMVEQRGVVRLVRDTAYASFDRAQRFLLLAPFAFDASTLEIWGPLLNGASLAIMPHGTPSLEEIGEAIARFKVTTLWLPAGLFNLMIDQRPAALAPLRQLITGGDSGSLSHFRRALDALPGVRLINGYGPTETTTFAVCLTARPENLGGTSVPIGWPIANTEAWILDGNLEPVRSGEEGELCIGGDGVARGYLGQPALTAERFVAPPWTADKSQRLYRTGDRARRRRDGLIEFLGRSDDQVKISGYRIEPGEIAAVLREHTGIRDAAVIVEESGEGAKRLVAYVVGRGAPAPDAAELRAYLGSKLPQFMIPSAFVALESIPLTSNGKVDRAALCAARPQASSAAATPAPVADSGSRLETAIAAVWRDVLRLDKVGLRDSFFDLGGDSLQLIEVHSKLRKSIQAKFTITDLFQYPTVADLAAHLGAGEAAGAPAGDDLEERARRQRAALQRRSPGAGSA
jgi:amino acid adenylation domain-containing protein